MSKKRKKYLIETSAVRAALGDSYVPQNQLLASEVEGGTLWSSVYIRMEYIRRWFCDMSRMAITISLCSDVSDALIVLEQDFKPRNVKGVLASIAMFLRERGSLSNTRRAAEEVASSAIRMIEHFDDVFPKRIPNTCHCQVGGMTPDVDYNRLLEDIHKFRESFLTPVQDCEVNAFLQLDRSRGRVATLLGDKAVRALGVGKFLEEYRGKKKWVTCKECSRIGDVVIALEQPSSWCLVHTDRSFNELSRCLDREHTLIKSVAALKKEQDTASQG
jgi:hypothetical protein